ncbi:MAG TPA: M1 family aminopeptidase, partial [Candidatus Acidoferrales bacterium]|nr:M1 family aminopeptidase [Candidatus Acidoferrales bacterium]
EFKLTFEYEGVLPRGQLDYITKDGILLRDESRWYPVVDISAFTGNKIVIGVPSNWFATTSSSGCSSIGAGLAATYTCETNRPVSSRSIAGFPGKALAFDCVPSPIQEQGFSRMQPLSACLARAQKDSPKQLAKSAHELLQRFNVALGPFPVAGLTLLQGFPGHQGAIGYSAPGFLVVSEDVIKYHDYPGWAPEFLPHEIAHQWFPIEVTLARSEDGWLAESLAEYLAWRYLREKEPEQARRIVQRAMRDALAPEPMRPLALGTRLFNEPWNVAYATLYQRGLLVWRTLETVIDRERVDRALREYYKRFAGRSASIADFRKICEEISGRELGWFFDYFLNATQIPEISLRRLPSDAPNVLLGEILVKNVPADFQVRVEMRVQTEKGAVEHSVATRGEVTPFSLNLPAPATQVMLDPDARLLRWTEAARRNREQLKSLQQMNDLADRDQFRDAAAVGARALVLDAEDLAANHQHIHFLMGRMYFLAGKLAEARKEFARALELASLDAMDTDFYRAWAHVYRARIAKRLGQTAAAQKEARTGFASNSPAMEIIVSWNEAPDYERSAGQELRKLAAAPK